VPLFILMRFLSLINTHGSLVLTYLTFGLPLAIWLLKGFYDNIPVQLDQAARIDGATRFEAFVKIAVPVAAPGLLAAGLLAFILSWNEFLFALILTGKATNTLPVGLAGFQTQRGVEIALLAAATMVAIVPVLILLPFMRRYLIKGLSLGALK
jgi:multiple sugar transport system permease protein